MVSKSPGKQSADAEGELRWGNNRWSRILHSLPFVGATVWVLVDEWISDDNWTLRDAWPMLLVLGVLSLLIMRPSVRITPDELWICILLTRKIPRAEVESAKFNYHGLVIRRRDGGSEFALLSPSLTSTELSWAGQPQPGSAAYEITRWAEQHAANDSRPQGSEQDH